MKSFQMNLRMGTLLYLVIVILAVLLRFINLGTLPLSDDEALTVLTAVQGTPYESPYFIETPNSVPQPSYEGLTQLLFQILGADDFLARAFPALAGAALVLTPLLAKKKLGWGQTVMMGLMLAVAPILVTVSRTASGVSLSILGLMSFGIAILGCDKENCRKNSSIAAIGLGLALCSGPMTFTALLMLGIGVLLWMLLYPSSREMIKQDLVLFTDLQSKIWILLVTIIIAATGFGSYASGLSRIFDSIGFWIKGWNSGIHYFWIILLVMIPIYMPVLTLLGILAGWKGLRNRERGTVFTFLLIIMGIVVIILYRDRQPHDLAWITLPLIYLGSQYLVSFIQNLFEQTRIVWTIVYSMLIILLAFMTYMQLSSMVAPEEYVSLTTAGMTILVFVVLVFISFSFFGLYKGWVVARQSVLFTGLFLSFCMSISSLWYLNFNPNVQSATELWRKKVASPGLSLLMKTLESTSLAKIGTTHGIEIEVIGKAPYSLVWALREFTPPEMVVMEESEGSPIILVSMSQENLLLPDDYIGQAISIGEKWGWNSTLPPEFLQWWLLRQSPVLHDEWIVLVRQDLAYLDENQ